MSSAQIPLPKAWSAGSGVPAAAPNWTDVEAVAQQLVRDANRLLNITSDPTLVALANAAADTGVYWVNWVGAHGYFPSTALSPATTYDNLWQTLQVVQFFLHKELKAILGRRSQLLTDDASPLAVGARPSGGSGYLAAIGGLLGQSPATAGRPGFGGPLGGGGAIGGKGPPSKTGPGGPLWSGSPVLGKGGGGAKGLPIGGSFPDPRQFGGVGSGSSSGGGSPGGGGTSAGLGGASTDVEHHWNDGTGGGGGSQSGGGQGGGQASPGGASTAPAVSVDAGTTEPPAPTPIPDTAKGGGRRPADEGAGGRSGTEKDNSTRFPTRGRPADDDPRGSGDAPHAPYHLGLYKGPELAPPIADANLLLPTPLWLQVQGTSGGSSAPQDDRGGNNPRFADPRLIYKPNPEDTSGGGGDPRVFVYKPNPEDNGGGSGGGVGGPRGRVESLAGTAARAALADGGATVRAPARVGLDATARATIRRART